MAWINEEHSKLGSVARFCGNVLRLGRIPQHVAIIMDGNRRYAKKFGLEQHSGHLHGFHKLTEVLEWCLLLNIREVSVYAFSTENFKRKKDEVDYLMDLAREKFGQLLQETEKLNEYRVRVRFVGDLTSLPRDIQQMCAKVMLATMENNRFYFNVFIAYASRVEMCFAATTVAEGVHRGMLQPSDVDSSLLDACCWTTTHHRTSASEADLVAGDAEESSRTSELRKRAVSPTSQVHTQPSIKDRTRSPYTSVVASYPDLVVRTSGEIRMSDYLLWQAGFSELVFFDVYWPEFSIWHFYSAILRYRIHADSVERSKQDAFAALSSIEKQPDSASEERRRSFLNRIDSEQVSWLRATAQ